jgi:hypothetical protein
MYMGEAGSDCEGLGICDGGRELFVRFCEAMKLHQRIASSRAFE